MSVQALLARGVVRRSWGALLGIALVLVLGLGAAITSIEAADRTASAYPDYLDRAQVADVVVNPVLSNEHTLEIIEGVPGVVAVTSDSLLTAGPDTLDPGSGPGLFVQTRVSQDGRYQDQDRPIVRSGRMVRSGREAFLNVAAAEAMAVEVGDELPLTFYGINTDDPTSSDPGPAVHHARVRVVGIGTFADDVLVDELYPRYRILVTPEAAASADCLQFVPEADDPRSFFELLLAAVPSDCAMTYRYYSLTVEGGADAAPAVVAEMGRRFRAENEHLPAALREGDAGYFPITSFAADDARNVRQSLGPAVAALRAFGVAAALATAATVLLLVVRHLRRRAAELEAWRSLGLGVTGRAVGIGLLPSVAGVIGVLGALVAGFVASPVGPVASARTIEPHPGRSLGSVAGLTAVSTLVVLLVGTAVMARWHAGRVVPSDRVARRGVWELPRLGPPFVALGWRAAVRGRDAGTAVIGAAAAAAVISAMAVFAVTLDRLVAEPERFGWPFDIALLANFGYGTVDADAVAADLDRPEVRAWGLAVLSGGLSIDGDALPSIAAREGRGPLVPESSIVSGRLPAGADEVALGASTASDLGREVGDEVMVSSPYGEHPATVTGIVVLPDVGPFESDRSSLGTGALVTGPLLEATYGRAEEEAGIAPAELADLQAGLVVIDLAPGTDTRRFLGDLDGGPSAWDPSGFGITYEDPVRPAPIVDVAAMRGLPAVLAGLFALAMAAAVVAGLGSGTRARRDELAVVRALGATVGQRRTSVRVHALTTAALGLLVGVPVGVVAGRLAFRQFADDLGVAPDVVTGTGLIGAIVLGSLLVALATAEVLGHRTVVRRSLPPDDRTA